MRLSSCMEAIKRVYASTFSQHAKALSAGHALPAGRGEDGGDPPAGGGRDARRALLSRLFRRGPLAQLLSRAADERSTTASRRWRLGLGRVGGRRREVPDVLPALSRGTCCSSRRWRTCWRTRSASSGRSSLTPAPAAAIEAAAGGALRTGRGRGRRHAARCWAPPTPPRTTPSTTASAGPGARLVSFRADPQARRLPAGRDSRPADARRRGRAGPPGRDRVRRAAAARARRAAPSSASCRSGRWRCRAKPRTLAHGRRGAGAAGLPEHARCSATAASRICATSWWSTSTASSARSSQEVAARGRALQRQAGRRATRPYLLIGVGRWGSTDPWLGIPVTWDQISGARVIVEAGFRDFRVTPSQGSHFFQNLTSFQVGYFTVNPDAGEGSSTGTGWPRSPRSKSTVRAPPALRATAARGDERQDQPGRDLQAGRELGAVVQTRSFRPRGPVARLY